MRFSRFRFRFRFRPAALCALLGWTALAAFAQDNGLSYVVTATRTAEPAESVPALVTVVTAADIAESGAQNLVQALESVPGLSFTQSLSGPGSEGVSMRGFGENAYGRVLVLVDGRRLNNPDMKTINWNAVALSDIERIEVLDGSASVLYGNSAVGGVINIITNKGSGKPVTTLAFEGGSFSSNGERFSHSRGTDWGAFSLSAEHLGSEGYRDRQASQTTNAALQGSVDLGDALSLSAQFSLADLSYQLPGYLTEAQFEDDPTEAVNWSDEGSERNYAASLSASWLPAEGVELELPLSYGARDVAAGTTLFGTPEYSDRFTQTGEARPKLVYDSTLAAIPLRFVGGADFYAARIDVDVYSDKERTAKTNAYTVTEYTAGPYLNLLADLFPSLSLSTGVRYDIAVIDCDSYDGTADGTKRHSAFVYDAGLVYWVTGGLRVYAKYGTLFRYPFTDEQAETYVGTGTFNKDLEAERGFNAEGGFGFSLAKDLSLAGNLYWMGMKDEIAYGASYHNENIDETRRFGASLSLKGKLGSFLDLNASYSWVDAVFAAGDNEGKRIPMVSEHSVDGQILVELPAGLDFGPTVLYRSASFQGGDFANDLDRVDAYFVLGAVVRYEIENFADGRLSLQATARNILDESYALVYWSGYYPADGRSLSLTAEYRF